MSAPDPIKTPGAPAVSIVMPCYNAAAHLAASIDSVHRQSFADWELIIVDDGSSDDSWAVLQAATQSDARIRTFRQANSGAAAARNHGLRQSRGRHIAFLDADDTWHPEFLARMVDALMTHPDVGIAYCGWQNLGLRKGLNEPFIPPEYENANKSESLFGHCRWPIHGALTYRRIILDAGCFDETLDSCMDFDLWLRIGTTHQLLRVPHVLAYYHHHDGNQITRNRSRTALNHSRVQQKFLQANPAFVSTLGKARIRELTTGELLKRGYECYWQRDLPAARNIFRAVMKQGYGTLSDWKYMLPAWLPESWHRWLLEKRDRTA